MDPTETLVLILDALRDGAKEEAIEHMDNLTEWLSRKGFCPDVAEAIRKHNEL